MIHTPQMCAGRHGFHWHEQPMFPKSYLNSDFLPLPQVLLSISLSDISTWISHKSIPRHMARWSRTSLHIPPALAEDVYLLLYCPNQDTVAPLFPSPRCIQTHTQFIPVPKRCYKWPTSLFPQGHQALSQGAVSEFLAGIHAFWPCLLYFHGTARLISWSLPLSSHSPFPALALSVRCRHTTCKVLSDQGLRQASPASLSTIAQISRLLHWQIQPLQKLGQVGPHSYEGRLWFWVQPLT